MAEKFEVKNLYLNFGPNARYGNEGAGEDPEEREEDYGEDLAGLLAGLFDLDDEEECYSEEQIKELSMAVADKFELSAKRAREIVDYVFNWVEQEEGEETETD